MDPTSLARMAWRNLWRSRRRSALTLSSIAFGTLLAVLFTGMGDANFTAMIDMAARLGGGHVALQNSRTLDTPTLAHPVGGVPRLRRVALHDPDVARVVVRVTGQLMLQTAEQSYGAAYLAIDPESEDVSTLSILEALVEGEPFRSSDDRGIILGEKLARNLEAGLGRKVVFLLTDRNGEIVRDVARVTGILRTGSPSVDSALCLLPIDALRDLVGYTPVESTRLALFLRDQRESERVAQRLSLELPAEVAAEPWYELHPDLAGFIAMKVASARLMEGVILVLVAAGIFNTLFVSVMERVREFGILMAIGFSQRSLFGLVMLESLWLGTLGLVAAAVLTAGPYWWIATRGIDLSPWLGGSAPEVAGVAISPILYVGIFGEHLVQIGVAVLAATLLAGVYPAWRAGSFDPVDAVRRV
ncbi:MAG: ABC transporter permease [Myxococcota bacterium]